MSENDPRDRLGRSRRPAKYRSPEVWAQVRERYLAGVPAPQLALEYDVGLRNISHRAMAEGWTRKNQTRLRAEPNVRWMKRLPGQPVLTAHQRALKEFKTTWPEVWEALAEYATEMADAALQEHPEEAWPLCEWAYRWRADTFGPECAAADGERARRAEAEGEARVLLRAARAAVVPVPNDDEDDEAWQAVRVPR